MKRRRCPRPDASPERRRKTPSLRGALPLLVSLAAAPAYAGEPSKAPADAKAEASADAAEAKSDEADKEALQKYEEGQKAQKAGQHEKAREALLASWKLKQAPETALALGKSEMALAKYRDAAEHLNTYLQNAQTSKAEDKQAAEKLFAEAKTKIGVLVVRVNAEGAAIRVDGIAVGKAPLRGPLFLEPGSRTIEAQKEGSEPAKKVLGVAAGFDGTVELSLAPRMPPPLPPPPPLATGGPNPTLMYAGIGLAGGLALLSLGGMIGSNLLDDSSYATWTNNRCVRANEQCAAEFRGSQEVSAMMGNTAFWAILGATALGGGTAAYALLGGKSHPTERSASIRLLPGGIVVTGSF